MSLVIDAILASYGVAIVPTSRRRGPGETHAGAVLQRIFTHHSKEHLCLTLCLIRGSARNREALHSETIGGLSDALAQRPDWHARYEELVEAVEAIDLDAMRNDCTSLRPWPVRATMRAMVYRALENRLDATVPIQLPGYERCAA